MKTNLKLLIKIVGVTFVVFILVLSGTKAFGRTDLIASISIGYVVSLFNIIGSFFSLKWGFRKATKTFFLAVIGGMILRFAIIGGALFWVWKYSHLNPIAFVISLILFYLMLQIFEIRYIHQELKFNR